MTLVDTNVLLDVATNQPGWVEWSARALGMASVEGSVLINGIVYAEFSVRYERIEDADEFLARAAVELIEIPRAALFLAGKAFARYRAAGGVRTSVLSDFFIGAHAAVLDIPVLTRDVRRYKTYFPEVRLIAPQLN